MDAASATFPRIAATKNPPDAIRGNADDDASSKANATAAPGRKRKRGAGSRKKRVRSGVETRERKAGCSDKHDERLRARAVREGAVIRSSSFSIQHHASVATTGWHGRPPPRITHQKLIAEYEAGKIKELLRSFFPVRFESSER
jgi:hypothetical protein